MHANAGACCCPWTRHLDHPRPPIPAPVTSPSAPYSRRLCEVKHRRFTSRGRGYTKWNFDVPLRRKGMSHAAPAPPDYRHDLADPRRWQALVLLCLAQFMVILDITVVNVALPAIGADLSLDRAALTWVVTAYTLCFGGLMLLGGRLADLLGRRRMFGAGLAGDGTVLVAARALQGVGAALLPPAALSIITTTFQGRERYRALGVWAALGGAGAAVGVLLGGTLTSGPGWPWVFF